jgi:plasmid stabilization system protein ParE
MKQDFVLQKMGRVSSSYQQRLYSPGKAFALMLIWALGIFTIVSPVWAWVCKYKIRVTSLYAILPVLLLIASIGSLLLMPIADTVSVKDPRIRFRRYQSRINGIYRQLEENKPEIANEKMPEALRARILKEVENPYQGRSIREESSPGNFTITEDAQYQLIINLYEEHGYPILIDRLSR